MKRLPNPFKPTAGKNPPELIGRDDVLLEFEEALQNGAGAPGRLMRISGIRGMGKTVMLNELGALADKAGWTVVEETANGDFVQRILDRLVGTDWSRAVVEPHAFGAKLGSLEIERRDISLRDALLRSAQGAGILITLDEVQDASISQTRALAVAVQHVIREDGDIAFVFAGLPSMVDGVVNGESLTFLRRAVPFSLGPLEAYQVFDSLGDTFRGAGVSIDDSVIEALTQAAGGYPFMVQLVGYHTWQRASRRGAAQVSHDDADRGIVAARCRFDETVIEPVLHHMPPMQVRYLLAMAEDDGDSSTGCVAQRLGRSASEAGVYRERLLAASVIDAGAWGRVRFAIPYLREYLRSHGERIRSELD